VLIDGSPHRVFSEKETRLDDAELIPLSQFSLPPRVKNYSQLLSSFQEPIRLFVSGDRSSVGKSTCCLYLILSLLRLGISPHDIAYIKPVTQCEADQPVVELCQILGITCRGIGPVVFYKGFTRAFLEGSVGTGTELIHSAVQAVDEIGRGKRIVLVDGVGYPAVGSICGISNADMAKALGSPVVIIGKSGVGDAVDSFNLNAR
jgi:dethiobiotin synthetase